VEDLRDQAGFLLTVLTRSLPSYLTGFLRPRSRPTHVLFCLVDHFEPGTGKVAPDIERARMAELLAKYPPLADAHVDASGHHPRRTWFFPPHYHRYGNLRELVSLCQRGYGEIELHLHHGKTAPDTAENLRETLDLCLRDYSRFGIFGTEDGRTRYGFVHGDYALNNSLLGGRCCGVNSELAILSETGCYADYTFPSCVRSNPRLINRIYYADTAPHRPKAYSSGVLARASAGPQAGLLMIQGPVRPVWVQGRATFGDAFSNQRLLTSKLIDAWVGTSIHVDGKRDWIIVKAHTHGAPNGEAALGNAMHEAFSYLETAYNDGAAYVLHYVTARELYNIIRAVEAGETGDPDLYRDYRVAPPCYDSSPEIYEASDELREAFSRTYQG
jgi:hypothetical protein